MKRLKILFFVLLVDFSVVIILIASQPDPPATIKFSESTENIKPETKNRTEIIDISQSFGKEEYVFASSLFSEIRYIPLESTLESFMRSIRKVNIVGDNIIVLTSDYLIFRFNSAGKFLNRIGSVGRGPDEYLVPIHFNVLEGSDKVAILENNGGGRVHIFNFEGKCERTFKSPILATGLAYYKNTILLWVNMPLVSLTDNYSLFLLDLNGKIRKRMMLRSRDVPKNPAVLQMEGPKFYRFRDSLSIWEANIDTIYRFVDEKNVFPRYVLKAGKDHLTWEKRSRTDSGDASVRSSSVYFSEMVETEQSIFLRANVKGERKNYIYSKKYKNVISVKSFTFFNGVFSWNGVLNDIDGGPTIWPSGSYSKNEIVATMEPLAVKRHLENVENLKKSGNLPKWFEYDSNKHVALKAQVSAAGENSNPWVVIAKLK